MNINEIKDYIIKKYPDCCLAANIAMGHTYTEEELVKECEDFFHHEKLKWCGCGSPEVAKRVIRDFLKILMAVHIMNTNDWQAKFRKKHALMKERFGVESVYDNELLLCFAYAMDAAGFTEHGSSIVGAWITEEGKMFLWLLEQNEELYESED